MENSVVVGLSHQFLSLHCKLFSNSKSKCYEKQILRITAATAFMFATVAGSANENLNVAPYSDTELEVLETADKGQTNFQKKR